MALNAAGFAVCRRVTVGDNKKQITNAFDEEKKHADIILITDGLGPTADDITKPLLCEYFGGKMVTNAFSAEVGVFHQPTTLTNKAFF